MAADGYPSNPRTGDPITGAEQDGDGSSYVLHAGTADSDAGLVSAGGRVLSIVGRGRDLSAARAAAYERIAGIDLPGSHYRTDIARSAELGEIRLPG